MGSTVFLSFCCVLSPCNVPFLLSPFLSCFEWTIFHWFTLILSQIWKSITCIYSSAFFIFLIKEKNKKKSFTCLYLKRKSKFKLLSLSSMSCPQNIYSCELSVFFCCWLSDVILRWLLFNLGVKQYIFTPQVLFHLMIVWVMKQQVSQVTAYSSSIIN